MKNMVETRHSGWIWINNLKSTQIKSEIMGKYLFFSDNKEELIELAKKVLKKCNLLRAKTPDSDLPNTNEGFGFVLCIYDTHSRYCNELKKMETDSISFRYWKSDEATRQKKYSKQYLINK